MGIIARILRLRKDLSAKIIDMPETGHYEDVTNMTCSDPYGGTHKNEWVVDQHEVSRPDFAKRERARQELLEIYQNSKWYQFLRRYLAGKSIVL